MLNISRQLSCLLGNSGRLVLNRFFSATPSQHQEIASQPLVRRDDYDFGATVLTLNNPKKANALSYDMLCAIEKNIQSASEDKLTRAIIIKSEGKVFSAGHDLRELTTERGKEFHAMVFEKCSDVMKMVQDIPVPIIAQVSGLATAAGCQLVASCDIAVAAESARFATPGVHVGLFCSTPAVAIGRCIPRKVAMEMLLTGEPISAQEALLYGLVSRVVPDDQLEMATMTLAQKICTKSKTVIALGKLVFNRQMADSRDGAYCFATDAMVENAKLVDCQEGINAFIEKRKPKWTHGGDQVQTTPKSN